MVPMKVRTEAELEILPARTISAAPLGVTTAVHLAVAMFDSELSLRKNGRQLHQSKIKTPITQLSSFHWRSIGFQDTLVSKRSQGHRLN
jgi:hypothetical protein